MATGLEKSSTGRQHFDIYAILEGPQELYFGDEVQVNVNLVEQVELALDDNTKIKKCYLSPTKRRGVERRSLIWAPTSGGELLGDREQCGIPGTCAKTECPICSIFGALQPGQATLVGRLTHGGGVAIQKLRPQEKQRAMHPAEINRQKETSPTPFRREYNEPGLLYPVSNHLLSVTDYEFNGAAYAFLDALARVGAGNPKGVQLFEKEQEPLLVVDRYLSPLGKRPLISPHITNVEEAIQSFQHRAHWVHGEVHESNHIQHERFERRIGDQALTYLQSCADEFVASCLQG